MNSLSLIVENNLDFNAQEAGKATVTAGPVDNAFVVQQELDLSFMATLSNALTPEVNYTHSEAIPEAISCNQCNAHKFLKSNEKHKENTNILDTIPLIYSEELISQSETQMQNIADYDESDEYAEKDNNNQEVISYIEHKIDNIHRDAMPDSGINGLMQVEYITFEEKKEHIALEDEKTEIELMENIHSYRNIVKNTAKNLDNSYATDKRHLIPPEEQLDLQSIQPVLEPNPQKQLPESQQATNCIEDYVQDIDEIARPHKNDAIYLNQNTGKLTVADHFQINTPIVPKKIELVKKHEVVIQTIALSQNMRDNANNFSTINNELDYTLITKKIPVIIRHHIGQHTNKLTIHLEPEKLGKIDIDIQYQDKKVGIVLKVINPNTFTAIHDSIFHIREAVMQCGYNASDINLETRLIETNWTFQNFNENASQNNNFQNREYQRNDNDHSKLNEDIHIANVNILALNEDNNVNIVI